METAAPASSPHAYRSRRPERTVLYRALAHHFERFLLLYEERFQRARGYLRPCVEPAVHRYLDCGIFDQGVARIRCPDCRHEFLIAFSCKLRGLCPSCHQKRELLWAEWAEQQLLEDVPQSQVVFTIPKRLRIFFRHDRKLLGELAGCAWRALKLYFDSYFDGSDVTPGAVGFVQTAGELLNFHPHVHVLVTDGGFLPDGTFHPLVWFHSQHVERLFRAEVLRMLLNRELITGAVVDNLLSWRHSGFSAHGAVRVEDRQGAVRLGRYMIRCPIALKRLNWDQQTAEVLYRGRPTRRGGLERSGARWDVLEFLARVVDHIPEPSQQTVRYWGFYANAARGKRRKAKQAGETRQAPCRQDDEILADPLYSERFTGIFLITQQVIHCNDRVFDLAKSFETLRAFDAPQLIDGEVIDYSFGARCKGYGLGGSPLDPIVNSSGFPVLVSNGALDALTPRIWGESVYENIDNARMITFPNLGHGATRKSPCSRDITNAFFMYPEGELNLSCIETLRPVFVLPGDALPE